MRTFLPGAGVRIHSLLLLLVTHSALGDKTTRPQPSCGGVLFGRARVGLDDDSRHTPAPGIRHPHGYLADRDARRTVARPQQLCRGAEAGGFEQGHLPGTWV